jgi:hypothetical protein
MFNNYITIRGDEMPKADTAKWAQINLTYYLRPNTKRRYFWSIFWKFIPYITGDTLDLSLCVKSTDRDVHKYNFKWQLQYWSLIQEEYLCEYEDCGSFVSSSKGSKIGLNTHLLMHEAEYHIIVTVESVENPNNKRAQTLLNFKVMPCDVFYGRIIALLTDGLVGAIIGAAIAAIATLATKGKP